MRILNFIVFTFGSAACITSKIKQKSFIEHQSVNFLFEEKMYLREFKRWLVIDGGSLNQHTIRKGSVEVPFGPL